MQYENAPGSRMLESLILEDSEQIPDRNPVWTKIAERFSDEEFTDELIVPKNPLKLKHSEEPKYIVNKIRLTKNEINDKTCAILENGRFKCPVFNCMETFRRKYNAKMHLIHVHYNIREYQCTMCCRRSKRKNDILAHLNIHKKNKTCV